MSPPMAPSWKFRAGGVHVASSVVQLDLDEEMGPMHGMSRSAHHQKSGVASVPLSPSSEDHRLMLTTPSKRAELTTFLCFLRKAIGFTMVHVDKKETRLMPAFRVSTSLHVEHRRPKAGDAPHKGLLKVERRGFGLRFQGSGFRV